MIYPVSLSLPPGQKPTHVVTNERPFGLGLGMKLCRASSDPPLPRPGPGRSPATSRRGKSRG